MYSTLKLTLKDKIATLTLNRPDKRNAISRAMIDELPVALQEVETSTARVLVLAAEGKAFCAGMDLAELGELAEHGIEANHQHSERIAQLFRALYEFPRPTIAAVNGAAIAGGAGLATLCDFTLASAEAKFAYTEVRIGWVPALVSAFLRRQVGDKQARELLLTGRVIGAVEAYRMGLVNEVLESAQLAGRVRQLAEELLQNSPASLRATKLLLRSYTDAELSHDIESGIEANAAMIGTGDFREGVRSFLERRTPQWSE